MGHLPLSPVSEDHAVPHPLEAPVNLAAIHIPLDISSEHAGNGMFDGSVNMESASMADEQPLDGAAQRQAPVLVSRSAKREPIPAQLSFNSLKFNERNPIRQ